MVLKISCLNFVYSNNSNIITKIITYNYLDDCKKTLKHLIPKKVE